MKCPFCGEKATADFVDIGVGMQQVDPWGCDGCMAFEAKSREEYESTPEQDRKDGWIKYRPLEGETKFT